MPYNLPALIQKACKLNKICVHRTLTLKPLTKGFLSIFIGLLISFLLTHNLPKAQVEAATYSLTHRVDWNTGKFNDTEADTNEGDLKLLGDGSWGPRVWQTPNLTLSYGTAIESDGSYIYVLVGRDGYFTRYIPDENKWEELSQPMSTPDAGSDMVYLNGYLYTSFGGQQKEFRKYNISTDTWTDLADLPDLINEGASIATDGTNIYASRGNNSTEFWMYDVAANSWSIKSSTPATLNYGSGLIYHSGYLYAPRGNNTTTFYKYQLSNDTWSTASPAPGTLRDNTANYDIKDGVIYLAAGNATNTFYKYDTATDTWSTITATPEITRYVGVVYNESDDQVYVFRGNNTYDMWKYDDVNDVFLGPADLPATPGSGADFLYYNGYIYYIRGRNTTELYRYNISTNAWESRSAAPASFNDDTKAEIVNGVIYAFRGSNTLTFYSYDIATNTWSTLADAPNTIRYGGALAYPGSGDYIYATRGNYTLEFWRYSISGNTWDDVSVSDLPDNTEASYGARLVSDGTDVYYFSGSRTSQFLKYDINGNTWTSLSSLFYGPNFGTDVTYYNGDFYLQEGYFSKNFWKYDISADTWTYLENLIQYTGTLAGPYNGGSLEVDNTGNIYSIRGSDQPNINVFNSSTYNYPVSGTWISDTIDLTYVSSWNSLTKTEATPSDSSISLETRTSTDLTTWSSWEAVSGTTIASPARRYMQVRATLNSSTDRVSTPVLNSLVIDYDGDTTAPTNPDAFTGLSQEIGGTALVSGNTYRYQNPYFSWSGASDADSAVAGYYVYFGTNNTADPETEGIYQSETNYTVTANLSNSTYYLRIKTKDTAGNISSAITGFSFVYNGPSTQSVSATLTADFALGTATDTSTADDSIKLENTSDFWKEEVLSNAPANINYGSDSVYVESENKIYVFRGNNTSLFYEYDISTNTWTQKADTPDTVHYGGALTWGPSGYIYAFRGFNTTSFWRYNISTDTWSDGDAADSPLAVYQGGALKYDGSRYIYAMIGNTNDAFLRYDTTGNTWDSLANLDFGAPSNQPSNIVHEGGDITHNGDDTMYAIQGNTYTGFSMYSISTDEWTPLDNLPAKPFYGADIEYVSNDNSIYYISSWNSPFLFKYSIADEAWTKLADGPLNFTTGTNMVAVGTDLFIIRGGNTAYFYKYDTVLDGWEIPTRNLFGGLFRGSNLRTFNYGANIVKGNGDYFYLNRGNYDSSFVRFDASSGEVVELATAPLSFYVGAAMAYDSTNQKVYATASQQDNRLMVYDISTNTWSEEASDPLPFDPSSGASMIYDGSQYIYWIRGGNTNTFYRFNTQGTSGNKWEALANTPAGLNYGSRLVSKGGYIYTMRGNNVTPNPLYRYDPGTDSWTTLTSVEDRMYNDGFLVDSGSDDYLYACRAGNTKSCYKYSISGDSWSALADAPDNIYQGGSAASDGNGKVYVIAGAGTNTFQDAIYTLVTQTDSTAFETSGDFVSVSHDLSSIYKFANLSVTYSTPNNTTLTISTRSSSDNSTWENWSEVTEEKQDGSSFEYKINSTPNRYLQVKFELTSADGIYSPTISDYTINYYQDTTAPTNPSSLTAYDSSSQNTTLTTDTWNTYSAPHFDWPDAEEANGASDTATGSGVNGYYVYLGTNASGDPSVDGTLVSQSSYTASSLTSGQTYYLRIETVDEAGTISAAVWAPFIYKYDATAPTTPTDLVADPAGYSATDSFDFSWSASSDTGAGGIEYCYKTGASTGTYATDQCTSNIYVEGVPSYKSATNTFYVRSKDAAGNYSAYSETNYFYSADAPSPPQNLSVTPSTNTVNSFSFSWDAPSVYFGSEANIRYYYSINALPTASSVTETASTALGASSYATLPGENTFYVVAKDEAGNIDYAQYASVTFTANTTAPGIPTNVDIADVSVKATSSWKIAVSWEEPTSAGAGVASYKIFRSLSESGSYSEIATSAGISHVDTNLTQQTYYYKIKACDNANNCGAFSSVVSLYPDGKFVEPPELTSGPTVTSITTKKATISWGTDRTSDSKVEYGTKSGDYFDEEPSNSTQVTDHTIVMSNLSPGTKYFYRAKWTDEDGNTGFSAEKTFSTDPAPTITDPKVPVVGIDNVTIEFTVKGASSAKIYYGETTSFGGLSEIATSTSEATYRVSLTGLSDGTKYFYKINTYDTESDEYEGNILSFETLPRPRIDGVKIQQVKGTAQPTVLVSWTTNTEISSIITYYPDGNPSAARDEVNVALVAGEHRMLIRGLSPQSRYLLTVTGRDIAGNEATSEQLTFTTATDTRPPAITDLRVEGTIVKGTSSSESSAQLVVSWNTDEPATSQVEIGEGTGTTYSQKTQEDTNLTYNHLVVISGLRPSNVYHLRALTKDSAGNLKESIDTVTITPKATDNALDLVLTNLQEAFGFLGQVQ